MLGVGLWKALAGDRVLTLNIGLELARLDPPLVAPAHLNGRQIARADQRIRLYLRDVQQFLNVGESEKACGHAPIVARASLRDPFSTSVASATVARHDGRYR